MSRRISLDTLRIEYDNGGITFSRGDDVVRLFIGERAIVEFTCGTLEDTMFEVLISDIARPCSIRCESSKVIDYSPGRIEFVVSGPPITPRSAAMEAFLKLFPQSEHATIERGVKYLIELLQQGVKQP